MDDAIANDLLALRADLERAFPAYAPRLAEAGRIARLSDGVAIVRGLDDIRIGARVECRSVGGRKIAALVGAIREDGAACILLGDDGALSVGGAVRLGEPAITVPVGPALLGRVVDPLGAPLDGRPEIDRAERLPAERLPPPILDRGPVTRPLHTGTTVVDALMPLGRGQRELIVGDRRTGKSTLALDAILSQTAGDVVCVHVSIGQRAAATLAAVDAARRADRLANCIFVVAAADAPAGLLWIAPFAACSMAEHFRDSGRDVLLVIDDLSKHAAVHRQIGLLLRNPPGREAFPGDTFYLHARLLERAAQLSADKGGGSLSILAVSETEGGDIAGYIPTNLISIVDGQIVCDARLWALGQRPAVDVARSVSRVGGKAQPAALRKLAAPLKLDYAQFLELEDFSRFGGLADAGAVARLAHGARIRRALAQAPGAPLSQIEEFVLLFAVARRLFDGSPPDSVDRVRAVASDMAARRLPALAQTIAAGTEPAHAELDLLEADLRAFLEKGA